MPKRIMRTEWGERPTSRQTTLLTNGDPGSNTVLTQLDIRNGDFVFIIPIELANHLHLNPYGRFMVTFIEEKYVRKEEIEAIEEIAT